MVSSIAAWMRALGNCAGGPDTGKNLLRTVVQPQRKVLTQLWFIHRHANGAARGIAAGETLAQKIGIGVERQSRGKQRG